MFKEMALQALNSLPDDATMDDFIERLYLMVRCKKGLEDVENGRFISHEQLLRKLEIWQ